MTMENPPFEDVFPIEHGDFPISCEFSGVYILLTRIPYERWDDHYLYSNS